MAQLTRFGRRVPLPSTVQIVHDLLVAQQNDNAAGANTAKDGRSNIDPEIGPPTEKISVPPQG